MYFVALPQNVYLSPGDPSFFLWRMMLANNIGWEVCVLPGIGTVRLVLDFNHSTRPVVAPGCTWNLKFPDDE